MFDKLDKFGIGFDNFDVRKSMFEAVKRSSEYAYPPYNIRKVNDDKYVVEIAAAGFDITNFEITLDGELLNIKCTPTSMQGEYLWHGISSKEWNRSFVLNENVTVTSSTLMNGMLRIWLAHNAPEKKQPLKINIQQPSAKDTRNLLNEDSVI